MIIRAFNYVVSSM